MGAVQAMSSSSERPHGKTPRGEQTGTGADPELGGERVQTGDQSVNQKACSGMLPSLFLELESEAVRGRLCGGSADLQCHPAGTVHSAGVVLVAEQEHGRHGAGLTADGGPTPAGRSV